MRVQHPQVHQRTDRKGTYWFFRYWIEEPLPDGSIKTTRRFHSLGPSKGRDALTQLEAEARRDQVLAALNTPPPLPAAVALQQQPTDAGTILFGDLAEMWRKDYVDFAFRAFAAFQDYLVKPQSALLAEPVEDLRERQVPHLNIGSAARGCGAVVAAGCAAGFVIQLG